MLSSTDILITTLKNCNTNTYNTGLIDGLYIGFVMMSMMLTLIGCYDFYKSYKKMLDKLDRMDANTILEVNEEIRRTNELPSQLRNESPPVECKTD